MAESPEPATQSLPNALAVIPGGRWFHLSDPSSAALDELAAHFGIHPLQVEDCRHRRQTARLEEHERYTFVVIKVLVTPHGERAANHGAAPAANSTNPEAATPAPTAASAPRRAPWYQVALVGGGWVFLMADFPAESTRWL
jgi:Mg2+ and Co2+ transporter CorA